MLRIRLNALLAGLAALGFTASLVSCGTSGGGSFGSDALVQMVTTSIPPAVTGQEDYSVAFDANFPHPPGTFKVSGGALPPGMALNSISGLLTGIPRLQGVYHFEIEAQDGEDPAFPAGRDQTFAADRQTFVLPVTKGPPNLLDQVVPAGVYHQSYNFQLDAAGGTPPYVFTDVTLPPDGLPNGLSVGATGIIGNLPNASQGVVPFYFTVLLTDADGNTDTQTLSMTVVVPPLIIFTQSPLQPSAAVFPYSNQLTLASNGAGAPFIWTQVAPGPGETLLSDIDMELTTDGLFHNKPGFPGPRANVNPLLPYTILFTVNVIDGLQPAPQSATRQYSFTVNPGPVLTLISPNRSSSAGPFTAYGFNFQPGASLTFKPGVGSVTIFPTVQPGGTTMTFPTAPSTPAGGAGAVSVLVTNPDGGNYTLPSAFIFPAANLTFGTKGFLVSPLSSTGLDAADVNGDGKADIVHCGAVNFESMPGYPSSAGYAKSTAGGLNLHLNTGGSPPAFATNNLDGGNFWDVKFADVNNDGKLDIVALSSTAVRVWLNGPLGTFTPGPSSTFAVGITQPSEMAIGKIDSDNILDVAYAASYYPNVNGSVFTMKGDGLGNFTQISSNTSTLPGTSYGVLSICLPDLDSNGRADIFASRGFVNGSGFIGSYALNSQPSGAMGGFSPVSQVGLSYGNTTGCAAADFLGNGTPAVVTVHSQDPSDGNGKQINLLSGSTLGTSVALTAPGGLGKCVGAFDGDFDQKIDWAISFHTGGIGIYRGSTRALVQSFDASSGSPSVTSPRTGRMASGDLDGDGRPDILATTSYWATDAQPSLYSGGFSLQLAGNGGSMGVVFYLNSSN